MCGFVGIFDLPEGHAAALRKQLLAMSRKIRHRGPDWSGVFEGEHALISHERLAIIDPLSGKQPLYSPDGRYVLAVNGEIYNHEELRQELSGEYLFQTRSD
ncbi:MAG: asparagine synthetase B, partial [Victivallales bacterium]|nr:asparagine synthetase B [Victivallales bacterium]